MNKEDTKQAILGFTEFFKGITGNQDVKIPDDIAKKYEIEQTRGKDVDVLDKIRAEIEHIGGDDEKAFCKNLNESFKQGLKDALKVIDKYRAESEG